MGQFRPQRKKTLGQIAEGIEEGDGFLTLVEVVRVEDDVAKIDDEEARECFENMLAAKRLLQNVDVLPKKLVDELRSALNPEDRGASQRQSFRWQVHRPTISRQALKFSTETAGLV